MMPAIVLAALCMACGDADEERVPRPECRIVEAGTPLPLEVRETSGLAISAQDPGVLWTHNDGSHSAELFALAPDASLRGRVRVEGAENVDWEDVERAPCAAGDCLYIADIGDNAAGRDHIVLYEVPEPALDAESAAPSRVLRARYPDGPQDAEALFIVEGTPYIVTKGRRRDIVLFRVPAGSWDGDIAVLEPVRVLGPRPGRREDRVTGATTSPDGRYVLVRTRATLLFFRTQPLITGMVEAPIAFDLRPAREIQGEAVAMAEDGTVWLTSEGESAGSVPVRTRLHCTLPD